MFQRRSSICIVFISIFFAASGLLFGLDGKAVLDENSVGFLYLNVGKVYNLGITQLKKIDAPENAPVKVVLSQVWANAAQNFVAARANAQAKSCSANMRVLLGAVEMYNMDNQVMMSQLDMSPLVKNSYLKSEPKCPQGGKYSNQGDLSKDGKIACTIHKTVEDVAQNSGQSSGGNNAPQLSEAVAKILDFDSKGYFRPTGGLWLSFDQDMLPKIVLEASAKPKEFFEFLSGMNPNIEKPSKIEANLVVFDLPPAPKSKGPMKLEIHGDGVVIGSVPPSATPPQSWADPLKYIQAGDCSAVIELDGKKVVDLIRKQAMDRRGSAAAGADPDSLLPDQRLKSFKRLRLWAGGSKVILLAAFEDPKVRAELKQNLNTWFNQAREQAKAGLVNVPDQNQAANLKALIEKIKFTEKDEWLGYSLEGFDDPTMVTTGVAVTGILAAIAIPNFQKARDNARQKSCFANMRVLMGACEMYEMDKGKRLETLDVDALIKESYIKNAPVCPGQGKYSMDQGNKNSPIECSVHGRIPEN